MLNKTVLVIGAGRESVPALMTLGAAGFDIVTADGDPSAPGAWCEAVKARVVADTYDPDAILRAVTSDRSIQSIDGVLSVAADVPMSVTTVAYALGLPHLPHRIARLGADKVAMKLALEGAGFRTARGTVVLSPEDVDFDRVSRGRYVIKPVDSRGARGVVRLSGLSPSDMRLAIDEALAYSPSKTAVLEEWLEGPQFSTETVMVNGLSFTPGFLDRNYSRLDEFAPYVIEDGAEGPSQVVTELVEAQICRYVEMAAKAIVGNHSCIVKGDVVLMPQGPAIIELALRLSGGYMSSVLVPSITGYSLVVAAAKLACGIDVEIPKLPRRRDQSAAAIRFEIPKGSRNHPDRRRHEFGFGPTTDDAVADALRRIRHAE